MWVAIELDTGKLIPLHPPIPYPNTSPFQPTRLAPYDRSTSHNGIGRPDFRLVVRPLGAYDERSGRLEETGIKHGSEVCGQMCKGSYR
jgi:hypothetical protein